MLHATSPLRRDRGSGAPARGHEGHWRDDARQGAAELHHPRHRPHPGRGQHHRGWVRAYRDGGFDALYPKPRTDRGQPRRLAPEVAERLVALKTEHPTCSVRLIIKKARAEGIEDPLAPSTVHRLFSREGLFDRKPTADGADRRRFAFREAGELWMSDVMHGPKVRDAPTQPPKDLPPRVHRSCRHPDYAAPVARTLAGTDHRARNVGIITAPPGMPSACRLADIYPPPIRSVLFFPLPALSTEDPHGYTSAWFRQTHAPTTTR